MRCCWRMAHLRECAPLCCGSCRREDASRFCSTYWVGRPRPRLMRVRLSWNETRWRSWCRFWPHAAWATSRCQVEVGTHTKGCSDSVDWSGEVQFGENYFSPAYAELCIESIRVG